MIPPLEIWFAWPRLLALLTIIPALALLGWLAFRRGRQRLRLLSPSVPIRSRSRTARFLLGLAGIFLIVFACAGPRWGQEQVEAFRRRELMIVLDLSRSMQAEQPSRRERAVRALRDLVKTLETDGRTRVGLVAFAAQPKLLFPLTRDLGHLKAVLDQIEANDLPPFNNDASDATISGTRIGAALKLAVASLDEKCQSRTILLLSDGDDPVHDEEWINGTQASRRVGVPIHVVGLGDPEHDHTIPDQGQPLVFSGKIVQTRLREDVLQSIAQRSDGVYLAARTEPIPLGKLMQTLLERAPPIGSIVSEFQQAQVLRYACFLTPALFLLLGSIALPERFSQGSRELRGAVAVLALALVSASPAPEDLLRQGNEAFVRGDFERALSFYQQAQERTPDPGLIAYNQGIVCYRLGRYRDAELHFRCVLDDDLALPTRRAQAWYDLGNSLVQQASEKDAQLLAQSVTAYRSCLEQKDLTPDLRADANYNLEIAQLLWLRARSQQDEENPKSEIPEPSKQNPRPDAKKPSDASKGTPDPDGDPDDPDAIEKDDGSGPGSQKSKRAARGPLRVLPDDDHLMPLTREETEAHLRRLALRIGQDRRQGVQIRNSANVGRDW